MLYNSKTDSDTYFNLPKNKTWDTGKFKGKMIYDIKISDYVEFLVLCYGLLLWSGVVYL